jgi:hypothetical protein
LDKQAKLLNTLEDIVSSAESPELMKYFSEAKTEISRFMANYPFVAEILTEAAARLLQQDYKLNYLRDVTNQLDDEVVTLQENLNLLGDLFTTAHPEILTDEPGESGPTIH